MTALKSLQHHLVEKEKIRSGIIHDIERGLVPADKIASIPLEFLDVSKIPGVPAANLLTSSKSYKPFHYPAGYSTFMDQNNVHWLPKEVPLADDVKEWDRVLTDEERHLLMQIFRLFTQNDVLVNDMYMDHYSKVFLPAEVRLALGAIMNTEGVHITAYSHLLDTIGIPEVEYSVFLEYKEMADKHDYMRSFNMNTLEGIACSLVAFGAFTEGVQLFASFAILLNFPRMNKMKGMGQIVAWSCRDEQLHIDFVAMLSRMFREEFAAVLDMSKINALVGDIARHVVTNEDRFIDLAFGMGPIEGLTPGEMKNYVRFITNRRLIQFGHQPIFDVLTNPIPWVDDAMNAVEHANFFENRSTEYSRAATQGTWEEAFAMLFGSVHKDA